MPELPGPPPAADRTTLAPPDTPGPPEPELSLETLFALYPKFRCPGCHQNIEHEPSCPDCKLCVACCSCVICEHCGKNTPRAPCTTCRACVECCKCWVCEVCSARRPQATRKCGRCGGCQGTGCCGCWQCGGCSFWQSRGDSPCRRCGACINCCACIAVRHLNPRKPTFHLVPVGEKDIRAEKDRKGPPIGYRVENPSERFLATEIEVSGVLTGGNTHTARVVKKWGGAIVGDGSVPNGFEINTAPAAGDVFIAELQEICEALQKDGAYADTNAGAHVHVDARDFQFYDMRRLVFLYAKVEDGLYGLVAPGRLHSDYCHPCGELYTKNLRKGLVPKDNKVVLLKNMYNLSSAPDRQIKEVRRSKGSTPNRYYGLNLHSWMYRGTIECRTMHGSTDATKLTNWGILWAAILDHAMKMTEKQIEALNKRPIELLYDIAPTDELKQWVENRWAFFHRDRR